jgi:putrescine aminotransferase
MSESSLISWRQCEDLPIDDIWNLYRKFVNKSQAEILSSFGFGRERVRSASGCTIVTVKGRELLDFTGGIGVLNLGHNHPRILQARIEYQQLGKMEIHKNFFSPYVAALSHNISSILPGDLDVSYFCNSGSEAVEGAVKLAYKSYNGSRKYILHSDNSFHGKLMGSGSLTASPDVHFEYPQIPGVLSFPYNDINALRRALDEVPQGGASNVYAIIVEPFSAGTLRQCDDAFLVDMRQLCDENGIVLIFDEVYSGWCKCGDWFAFMRSGTIPDILCYSKSFGGGKSSISGYTTRTPVFERAYGNLHDALLHGTTYNAMGEECVTAMEAIQVMSDDDYPTLSRRIESRLSSGLAALKQKHPSVVQDVRGRGALHALILNPGPNFLQKMAALAPSPLLRDPRFMRKLVTGAVNEWLYSQHDLLTYQGTGLEVPLVLSPSIVVTDAQIDRALDALDQTLTSGLFAVVGRFVQKKLFS